MARSTQPAPSLGAALEMGRRPALATRPAPLASGYGREVATGSILTRRMCELHYARDVAHLRKSNGVLYCTTAMRTGLCSVSRVVEWRVWAEGTLTTQTKLELRVALGVATFSALRCMFLTNQAGVWSWSAGGRMIRYAYAIRRDFGCTSKNYMELERMGARSSTPRSSHLRTGGRV